MKNAMTPEMIATVTARINLMLGNAEINAIYQSMPTKEAAQDWIWAMAVSSLLGL